MMLVLAAVWVAIAPSATVRRGSAPLRHGVRGDQVIADLCHDMRGGHPLASRTALGLVESGR